MQTHAVWNDFLSCEKTLATQNRDYREWHKGRGKFAVWTIEIRNTRVWSRFDAAMDCLEKFLFVPYQRQPHITLLVCGFLTRNPCFDDDYGSQSLQRHVQNLQQARITPFEIQIGGLNSFAAAPFLEVFDVRGGLGQIREVLGSSHCEIRTRPYVPHLTIGLYAGAYPVGQVAEKISEFPENSWMTCLVDSITLSTYSAFEIAGPLFSEYIVQFQRPGT
jgi:2'-5' RNA ligase